MTSTAADYLRETSEAIRVRYSADCVAHACRLAELLLVEGRSPSIGRIREVIANGDQVYHGPLIPKRFPALTWTTHYVCCCDGDVYDPLAGTPITASAYDSAVFGRSLRIETFLDSVETRRLVNRGELRASFQPPGAERR